MKSILTIFILASLNTSFANKIDYITTGYDNYNYEITTSDTICDTIKLSNGNLYIGAILSIETAKLLVSDCPKSDKQFEINKTMIIEVNENSGDALPNITIPKCEILEQGILKNFTGIDACGWVIEFQDSSILEPINLYDFNLTLIENDTVCVEYIIRYDLGSYCMVGKKVEIAFIEQPLNHLNIFI